MLKKKKQKQCQQVESKWQGYEAEKLVKDFYRASKNSFTLTEWRELLESTLFTLTPYYDSICSIQRDNIGNQIITSMLSVRQIVTYNAALCNLTAGKVWETIHELMDFIQNFGEYRNKQLSEIETVIIYCLCQQIVYLIRVKEK